MCVFMWVCKRQTKIAFRYIAYFRRDYFTSSQNTYFILCMCVCVFVFYSWGSNRSEFAHRQKHSKLNLSSLIMNWMRGEYHLNDYLFFLFHLRNCSQFLSIRLRWMHLRGHISNEYFSFAIFRWSLNLPIFFCSVWSNNFFFSLQMNIQWPI